MASVNDILADLLRERAIHLARFDAATQKKILAHIKSLERDLAAKVAELEYFGELSPSARQSIDATLQWSGPTIQSAYQGIDQAQTQELRDLARVEAAWIGKQLNSVLDFQFIDTAMSPTGLAAIVSQSLVRGLPSEDWWAGQSQALQRRFSQELRLGVTAGESLGQLITRIKGNDNTPGIMEVSRRDAAALVRTSVQSVANETRVAIYKQNEDVVGALMHVSTLDDRTTAICISRDGLRWKIDGEPIGHSQPFQTPPLHWNCRSTLVPVTKSWRELGLNVDEMTPTQRASMDGVVPADMTYEQWLKTKSEEFQNKVLGLRKAELWREGSITFRDLVDQSGRPLTIDELEDIATARDPADLEPPGEVVSSAVEAPEQAAVQFANDPSVALAGDQIKKMGGDTYRLRGDAQTQVASHQALPDFYKDGAQDELVIYGGAEYGEISNERRQLGDTVFGEAGDGTLSKDLEALYKPLSQPMYLYRGTVSAERFSGLGVGDTLELSGFTSTSRNPVLAMEFAAGQVSQDSVVKSGKAGALIVFEVPKGQPAIVFNSNEQEVLLRHGSQWEVKAVQRNVSMIRVVNGRGVEYQTELVVRVGAK